MVPAKMGGPIEAYMESTNACIEQKTEIPQWYVILDENQEIIAGAGVIENDFHDWKNLIPNLCALYVEEAFRMKGIAQYILNFIRKDLGKVGVKKI